jgi:hypothetical protein
LDCYYISMTWNITLCLFRAAAAHSGWTPALQGDVLGAGAFGGRG